MRLANKMKMLTAMTAAALLALSGCGSSGGASGGSSNSVASSGDGMVIGALLPLTGTLAYLAPPEVAAIKLAISDINKAGGVLGKDVTEVEADTSDGEHADQKRRDHRDPHVAAADDEHGGHRAAGCDAAVHRQIGHIEDSIGNIHANRHDAPDHALRTGAGERVKQLGNLHWIVLLMIRMKPRERSAASLAHADVFENRFYSIAT